MQTRIQKLVLTILALGALAFGGAQIANAGGAKATPEPAGEVESTAPENSATDPDNIQYEGTGNEAGEATTAKAAKASRHSSAKKAKKAKRAGSSKRTFVVAKKSQSTTAAPETGAEAPGTEAPEKGEAPGSETEGAEVPGDDGPGGHADEPGDPNADHQFEGEE
jgi:hypothetical protein